MDQDGMCNVTVNGGTVRWAKAKNLKSRSSRSTIDIYVDPADDLDIGKIFVMKKKSRAVLEGIRWVLGEVTNAEGGSALPPEEDTKRVKIKVEEKEKWWSIGCGRRSQGEASCEGPLCQCHSQLLRTSSTQHPTRAITPSTLDSCSVSQVPPTFIPQQH
ncbi:hypothetical protein K439DRAFT_92019 [Ramaria rubella]|nr:hypothetical protein K439DRAFT_92019 [Ramaria rubella]